MTWEYRPESSIADGGDGGRTVTLAEHGAAGNKHVCTRLLYKRGCLRVDAAVRLQLARRIDLQDALVQRCDLRQLIGHEALSAEAGLDRQ